MKRIVVTALIALAMQACNCAPVVEKPLTKEQIKKNTDMVWGGFQNATKARLVDK